MAQAPLWLTILLPLVGYVVGVTTEFLRNLWQTKREIRMRLALRQEARHDRRDNFELGVLNDTYAALSRCARAAMKYHVADLEVAKKSNVKYASHQIGAVTGPELEEEFRASCLDLSTQIHLLLDDDLRSQVDSSYKALQRPSLMHRSEVADAEHAMDEAIIQVELARTQLGERIRDLYSEDHRTSQIGS